MPCFSTFRRRFGIHAGLPSTSCRVIGCLRVIRTRRNFC
jgi:hypothetical protein